MLNYSKLKSNIHSSEFLTDGAFFGAIYPIKLPNDFERFKNKIISWFDSDFKMSSELRKLKKFTYFPDRKKVSDAIFHLNLQIEKCSLKNGSVYENLDLDLYLFVYKEGFASINFWIDFSKHQLNYDDIVLISSLMRNHKENNTSSQILFNWRNEDFEYNSFFQFGQLIENRILNSCGIYKIDDSIPRFNHPLVYLNSIVDCENANVIIEKFAYEIQGITNLWAGFEMKMSKQNESKLILKTDFHPFNYGISVASSILSLEVHSNNMADAAKFYSMDDKSMHFYERFDWSFQIESSMMEFYILRYYNHQLSNIPNVFTSTWSIINKPLLLIKLVRQLIRVSNTYREIFQSLDEFKNIYLTKRRYTDVASKQYAKIFRLNYLNSIIDNKLKSIQNQISMTYSMLTTLFIFAITILGFILALLQTINLVTKST